jgi:predicted RNA-binding Zn ribbon-like protein
MRSLNASTIDVDRGLDTCYSGVVSITVKPNSKSISQGEWARFIFIAGRLCIDFTQTGGETGKRAYWERFHEPADLADWFSISPLQLQGIQVDPEEFKSALSLREAIWRVAHTIQQNGTPLAKDIEIINSVASAPDLAPQLTQGGLKQSWKTSPTAMTALSTIARDAIDLFSSELRLRIRECENPNCGLMFVDTSRPGKRRWCLMKRCGNMAKTSNYRKSKRHS